MGKVVDIKPLPDWLDLELWNDYLENRREIGKPLSAVGEKRALKRLKKFIDQGGDQTAIIETSIDQNWRGLFFREKEETYKRVNGAVQGDDQQFIDNASKRGIQPRPGESMDAFRTRVIQTRGVK